MDKFYYLFLAGLMCLAFAVPLVAEEDDAIPAAGLQRVPVSLTPANPFACGLTIYDNTAGGYFYSTSTPRWNVLDDGNFPAGTAPVCLWCVELAWQQTVQQQLYIVVDFWDTVVPGGPVCNLTWLGGFYVDFGIVPVGGWTSGSIEIMTPITFPDDNWCVQFRYYRQITPSLITSTGAAVFFANGGPTVGTNDGTVYWRDASGNNAFECPAEARSFAPPNLAQFYLKLSATELPSPTEPESWGTIKAFYR
ncbi:MAG: hypothetical protein QME66_12470 [Candidatus Eisenbacteria bacterium]|nr:hypothetical protein [Candidatus Eisenbacteria bacterium]